MPSLASRVMLLSRLEIANCVVLSASSRKTRALVGLIEIIFQPTEILPKLPTYSPRRGWVFQVSVDSEKLRVV